MPEENDAQERSQEPTEKRKQESKEKGQIARSKDLNTFVMLFINSLILYFVGKLAFYQLSEFMQTIFTFSSQDVLLTEQVYSKFVLGLKAFTLILLPLLFVAILFVLITPSLFGGWNFSKESIKFQFKKINPFSGLKRMVSMKSFAEFFKSILKFLLILAFGLSYIVWQQENILNLAQLPLHSAIYQGMIILIFGFVFMMFAMLIIMAIDIPLQQWEHNKQLKMTFQEIKDERKQTDGSPEVKKRIQEVRQSIMSQRLKQDLPNADVIITNPTHYAVAIQYNKQNNQAPIVIAKGKDWMAQQIKKLAKEYNIAVISQPPLARALFHTTEMQMEIPAGLYIAVAKVLAYIYQLRRFEKGYTAKPKALNPLGLPSEYEEYMWG